MHVLLYNLKLHLISIVFALQLYTDHFTIHFYLIQKDDSYSDLLCTDVNLYYVILVKLEDVDVGVSQDLVLDTSLYLLLVAFQMVGSVQLHEMEMKLGGKSMPKVTGKTFLGVTVKTFSLFSPLCVLASNLFLKSFD